MQKRPKKGHRKKSMATRLTGINPKDKDFNPPVMIIESESDVVNTDVEDNQKMIVTLPQLQEDRYEASKDMMEACSDEEDMVVTLKREDERSELSKDNKEACIGEDEDVTQSFMEERCETIKDEKDIDIDTDEDMIVTLKEEDEKFKSCKDNKEGCIGEDGDVAVTLEEERSETCKDEKKFDVDTDEDMIMTLKEEKGPRNNKKENVSVIGSPDELVIAQPPQEDLDVLSTACKDMDEMEVSELLYERCLLRLDRYPENVTSIQQLTDGQKNPKCVQILPHPVNKEECTVSVMEKNK